MRSSCGSVAALEDCAFQATRLRVSGPALVIRADHGAAAVPLPVTGPVSPITAASSPK
jgi:hypothetical protein